MKHFIVFYQLVPKQTDGSTSSYDRASSPLLEETVEATDTDTAIMNRRDNLEEIEGYHYVLRAVCIESSYERIKSEVSEQLQGILKNACK